MSSFTCKHHFVPGPPPLAPPHHDAVDLGCYQQSLPGGPGGSQGVPWATIRIGGKTCTGPFDNSAGVCFGGRDKWGPLKKCDGATFFLDTSGKKSKWTVVWKDEMVQSCEVDKKVSQLDFFSPSGWQPSQSSVLGVENENLRAYFSIACVTGPTIQQLHCPCYQLI